MGLDALISGIKEAEVDLTSMFREERETYAFAVKRRA
jgi:hypothetical protein